MGQNKTNRTDEGVGPEQSVLVAEEREVFDSWRDAGLNENRAFRSTQSIRALAGQNVTEKLDALDSSVTSRVDALESRVTSKVEALETSVTEKLDALDSSVTTRVDALESRVTSKVEALETSVTLKVDALDSSVTTRVDALESRVTSKVDGVQANLEALRTESETKFADLSKRFDKLGEQVEKLSENVAELASEVKVLRSESKATKREVSILRWIIIFLIAFFGLLAALGWLDGSRPWRVLRSTPAQSVQAPIAEESPEPETPREVDPPQPLPQ